MHLVAVGLNHKTAPVAVREKLAFSGEKLQKSLAQLIQGEHLTEAIILSTCNRTEVYGVTVSTPELGLAEIRGFLNDSAATDFAIDKHLYNLVDTDVVYHLFQVISSLDSMILGEAQILGQTKAAFQFALECRGAGVYLTRLFQQAIEVGKRVRTETEIGENAVSISYAAVELARKIFGELTGRTVLIIGAGEMSELAVKNLAAHGIKSILVANRTYARAQELAAKFRGLAVDYDRLAEHLSKADIIISSTGAPHVVINKKMVKEAMRVRRNRPLFFIDIAVPRDIGEDIHSLNNVYLYNIDDLENVVEANLAKRGLQIEKAELIIAEEIEKFSEWLSSRQVVPIIKALREHGHGIRTQELERLFNRLPELSPKERDCIIFTTNLIVNKLLHHPVISLKEMAVQNQERSDLYSSIITRLFGLDLEEPTLAKETEEG